MLIIKKLGLFRILFGCCLLLDNFIERGLEDVDLRFSDPNQCFFPLFSWLGPVSVEVACVMYSVMIICTANVILGLQFWISCWTYLICYLYFFLLDKSRWNNHSYLYMLMLGILSFSSADDALSLKSEKSRDNSSPATITCAYYLLKFQLFLLYFYAGIKKLISSDWLHGYSMKHLSQRGWIFAPLRKVIATELIDFYMVHVGGLLYDLTVGFLLLGSGVWKKIGFLFSFMFHFMNSQLFDIAMFPYVCLSSLVLFVGEDEAKEKSTKFVVQTRRVHEHRINAPELSRKNKFILLIYILIQLMLPFSHFVTKGYNNWTEGLYGYSWDMMVHSWETLHQKVTVRIGDAEKYLDAEEWATNDRWSSHADMAVQYAQCIERNLKRYNPNIPKIEIYFDVWKSLNGRFQQRIFDPTVDILAADWSPWKITDWVLPLLTNFSNYRTSFDLIAQNLSAQQKDGIFIADFPGLTFENFLPQELTEVKLHLLHGQVSVAKESNFLAARSMLLNPGDSIPLKSNETHKIKTISLEPSCYYYEYKNGSKSEVNAEQQGFILDSLFLTNSLSKFINEKIDLFSRSFYLIMNSYLKLLFDVPMVLRAKVQ